MKQYNISLDSPYIWSYQTEILWQTVRRCTMFPRISKMMRYLILCNHSGFQECLGMFPVISRMIFYLLLRNIHVVSEIIQYILWHPSYLVFWDRNWINNIFASKHFSIDFIKIMVILGVGIISTFFCTQNVLATLIYFASSGIACLILENFMDCFR